MRGGARGNFATTNAFTNESKSEDSDKWGRNVHTLFNWNDIDDGIRKKVNEIGQDVAAGRTKTHHGPVTLKTGTKCLHWRLGDSRIFGQILTVKEARLFQFLGYGTHTGRDNSKYDVQLPAGKTKAEIS